MKGKNIFLVLSAAIVAVTITGCSGNSELEQLKKENEELKSRSEQFKETTSSEVVSDNDISANNDVLNTNTIKTDKYEYTKYSWLDDYGTSYCAAIVLKNTTKKIVDTKVDILLKDANGNIVDVSNSTIDLLIPNKEVVFWTSSETNFKDFDVKISFSDSLAESNVLEDGALKIDEHQVNNKIVFTTKNTSNKKVYTNDDIVLFFKDNKVVDLEMIFLDNTYGIEPSETCYTEAESDKTFDSYELYYSGYCED